MKKFIITICLLLFTTSVLADPIPYIILKKPRNRMLNMLWLNNGIPAHSEHYKELRSGGFDDSEEVYRELATCLLEMYVVFLTDCYVDEDQPWGETEADQILDKYEIKIKFGYMEIDDPGRTH